MKLLEKSDSEKSRLMKASAQYKQELKAEVKSISKSTERILTNALFIGGAMAITYFAVTQLAGSKSKKKKSRKRKDESENEPTEVQELSAPSVFSQVGDVVITQAVMLLLELAKDRLSSYLESRKPTDEDS